MAKKNVEKTYISTIKQFVNSDAWREYLRPMLNKVLQGELPKPTTSHWQDKYRYYYALANAFSSFINALENLANKEDFLKRIEKLNVPIDET